LHGSRRLSHPRVDLSERLLIRIRLAKHALEEETLAFGEATLVYGVGVAGCKFLRRWGFGCLRERRGRHCEKGNHYINDFHKISYIGVYDLKMWILILAAIVFSLRNEVRSSRPTNEVVEA
jgi:hypothetical protein